ncbi:MAG: alginate O-acetyltransferase [uncultured bacterium]|nr:MAG: alginate O-acetyltransferase [uncultured bacterium]
MTRGKTFARTALSIIFLLVLALFFLGTIFSEKKAISQQEKRPLARFPSFSGTATSLTAWPKSLTDYLKDHLFQREELVFLNSLMRVKLFRRSPHFVVLAGEEGWYFYMGDWALHDYLGKSGKTDAESTGSWENLIALRQQMLQKLGANYLVAIAPNKECLYPEFLPARFNGKAGTTMLEAMNTRMHDSPMSDHFLDLGETLRQAKTTGHIYFKTDSHWNPRGAYFAYRAIIERIRQWYPEVVPLPEDRFDKRPGMSTTGSDLVLVMGLIGGISEEVEDWDVQRPCAEPEDRIITSKTLPAGQSLTANGCPAGAALRALVISDSFGEGLHDYFSETFQDVVYSRDMTLPDLQSFITEYRPDIVLDLRVGRYLPKVMSPGRDEKI